MIDQPYTVEKLGQQKRAELLREADQARLAQQARLFAKTRSANQAQGGKTRLLSTAPLLGRALAWLGCRLVAWGERLQDRCRPVEAPVLRWE